MQFKIYQHCALSFCTYYGMYIRRSFGICVLFYVFLREFVVLKCMDFILLRVNDVGTPPPMILSVRTWRVTNETAPYFLLAGSCYVQYGNCGSVGVACR